LANARMRTSVIVSKLRKGYIIMQERQRQESTRELGQTTFTGQFFAPGMMGMPGAGMTGMPGGEPAQAIKEVIEGVEMPEKTEFIARNITPPEEIENLRNLNVSYHLIPSTPKPGEDIFAYVNVRWNAAKGEVEYIVIEPDITAADKDVIEKVKTDLEERLDVDFTKLGDVKGKELLRAEIEKSFSRIPNLYVDERKKRILAYYIERDVAGYGRIEAMMKDPNIEDISCDGLNVPLYIYHRSPKLGTVKTNIVFTDKDELDSFAVKLAQKCDKGISIAEPLLDGSLPDGSRVQATLGTDIARRGSNFTIRKFTEKPLTPTHMLKYRTLNSTQIAYLWLAIENGQSMLVSGGTATGKTALLNVLSLLIRPNMKVVSIEDTAELRLPLPHWVPHVARTPISTEGKVGEVSLFDLLKSSLRQRPDYIIVGEVRGKEAYVLFQQIATGHTGLATIHAANFTQLMDRLITPPISLPPTLIENISVIVFLVVSKIKGSYVRRANTIVEIVGMKGERPVTRTIFQWRPVDDSFEALEKSIIMKAIAERMGITEDKIREEISRRKRILEWMLEKEIFDYREVAKVVAMYYSNPVKLLNIMGGQ